MIPVKSRKMRDATAWGERIFPSGWGVDFSHPHAQEQKKPTKLVRLRRAARPQGYAVDFWKRAGMLVMAICFSLGRRQMA